MTVKIKKKIFDAIEYKRKAQSKIYNDIKELKPQEQIAYFRQQAESGALGNWWKKIKQQSENR